LRFIWLRWHPVLVVLFFIPAGAGGTLTRPKPSGPCWVQALELACAVMAWPSSLHLQTWEYQIRRLVALLIPACIVQHRILLFHVLHTGLHLGLLYSIPLHRLSRVPLAAHAVGPADFVGGHRIQSIDKSNKRRQLIQYCRVWRFLFGRIWYLPYSAIAPC
jgi:hypothetical protein